jgi:uncharacterized protein YktA (UPF0223 family)
MRKKEKQIKWTVKKVKAVKALFDALDAIADAGFSEEELSKFWNDFAEAVKKKVEKKRRKE